MNSLIDLVENTTKRLDNWLEENGWAGYDPYDLKGYPLFIKLTKQNPSFYREVLRKGVYGIELFAPLFLRKLFNIEKMTNAKAMGLFAEAYLSLFKTTQKEDYLIKAEQTLNWLSNNYSKGYSGMCWGYPFNWQSRVFIPRGTPSSVVSSTVGTAFWAFYKLTSDNKYFDVCKGICEFFINDLNIDKINNERICFSYTPIDNFHVNNANLFVAEFLIRVGKEIDNEKYINYGLKATNYTLNEQNNDGSIYYWGKDQENRYRIDHYHSGFEIRSLYSIWKLTANQNVYRALERYYKFYLKNLFIDTKIPKITPKNTYPINIHSCAEAILCTSTLIRDFPEGKEYLVNSLKWTIENMQTEKGWFVYIIRNLKGLKWKVKIPYIRWGQAWMLNALANALGIVRSKMS